MNQYLLDTDTCIYILKDQIPDIKQRLKALQAGQIKVSAITVAELEFGVQKSIYKKQNATAIIQFLATMEIIPFDPLHAKSYGQLRSDLEKKGKPIGSLDMLIAAQALACNCILVTNNTREFERIPSLPLENWIESKP